MRHKFMLLLFSGLILIFGCKKNDNSDNDPEITLDNNLSILTTLSVSIITYNTARCEVKFNRISSQYYTTYGACWSTHQFPTTADNKTEKSDFTPYDGFLYSSVLTGIELNTTYYVRSFAYHTEDTVYGNQLSFKFIAADLSIQQKLDAGFTPKQVYDSGTPLESLYGKTYQDGLIFYLNTSSGNGLVASTSESINKKWGVSNENIAGTLQNIGSGSENTNKILSGSYSPTQAARACRTTVSNTGWFLPSMDELQLMYTNLKQKGYGAFSNAIYWSSSQENNNAAYCLNFYQGTGYINEKNNLYYARCVKSF